VDRGAHALSFKDKDYLRVVDLAVTKKEGAGIGISGMTPRLVPPAAWYSEGL